MPKPAQNPAALPMQVRLASEQTPIGKIDADARTVEVVFSTGAAVRRARWSGWDTLVPFDEILTVSRDAVDLSRLNGGAAPVLDSHSAWRLGDQLGTVEKAWLAGKEARALLRFTPKGIDEETDRIFAKIAANVIRSVSVGYFLQKVRVEAPEKAGEVEKRIVEQWMPYEISFVAVGADAGAGVRSGAELQAVEIFNRAGDPPAHNSEDEMDKTQIAAAVADVFKRCGVANLDDAFAEGLVKRELLGDAAQKEIDAELARRKAAQPPAPAADPHAVETATRQAHAASADVFKRCRAVGLADDFALDLVGRGITGDKASTAITDEIAKRAAANGTGQPHRPLVEGGQDHSDPVAIRGAMSLALAARSSLHMADAKHRIAPEGRAQEFMQHSVLDMMADIARARGEKIPARLPPAALYDRLVQIRSLSTSDFPYLLADASNKVMIKAYELKAPTYRAFMARKTFSDFKPHSFVRAGDFPNLLAKGETGEFKYGTMGEAKQAITIAEYGRILRLSRRIFINDDLNAFADLPTKAGRRVADFENATAFAQFALNSGAGPTITETTRALFNTTDNTKASSNSAITVAAIGIGRAKMMGQTSIDGMKLNIAPAILLTGPDKATEAEQFCAVGVVPALASSVNPFAGKLRPHADANLSGNSWYLFADPMDLETMIYGYLNGAEGPRMMVEESFTTEGLDVKCALDFVAGAVDFRGGFWNAGA